MMMANNDDIFYSDDELSDSELYQVKANKLFLKSRALSFSLTPQGSNLGSRFSFPGNSESIFSTKLWPASSPGLSMSPENVSNTFYNTIDRWVSIHSMKVNITIDLLFFQSH